MKHVPTHRFLSCFGKMDRQTDWQTDLSNWCLKISFCWLDLQLYPQSCWRLFMYDRVFWWHHRHTWQVQASISAAAAHQRACGVSRESNDLHASGLIMHFMCFRPPAILWAHAVVGHGRNKGCFVWGEKVQMNISPKLLTARRSLEPWVNERCHCTHAVAALKEAVWAIQSSRSHSWCSEVGHEPCRVVSVG